MGVNGDQAAHTLPGHSSEDCLADPRVLCHLRRALAEHLLCSQLKRGTWGAKTTEAPPPCPRGAHSLAGRPDSSMAGLFQGLHWTRSDDSLRRQEPSVRLLETLRPPLQRAVSGGSNYSKDFSQGRCCTLQHGRVALAGGSVRLSWGATNPNPISPSGSSYQPSRSALKYSKGTNLHTSLNSTSSPYKLPGHHSGHTDFQPRRDVRSHLLA